jgi:hypothetical protein
MVHPRSGWGSGTAARARAVEELIRHIRQYEGVRFFSVAGLAEWVQANHEHFE